MNFRSRSSCPPSLSVSHSDASHGDALRPKTSHDNASHNNPSHKNPSHKDSSHKKKRDKAAGRPSVQRFLLIFLVLHLPLFIYPVLRLCDWLAAPWPLTLALLIPIASSQIPVRLLLRRRRVRPSKTLSKTLNQALNQTLKKTSDFLLGASPIVLMTLLVFELLVLAGLVAEVPAGLSVLAISAILCAISLLGAMLPMVKRITFDSPQLQAPVRFIQITDVHLGSRSVSFLEKLMNKIKSLEPDFLCITGDFVDASQIPESDMQSLASLDCPIYFSIGNHEQYEDLDDIITRLRNLGVKVLRTQAVDQRGDISVIGIDDRDDALQVRRELAKLAVRDHAFNILLYHRPRGFEAAAEAGVDLMLSGHTHNGQIFPFNLVVERFFDRIVGMHQLDASRLYVSQGTGTWGPVMRLGTRSEITLFELGCLNPQQND